MIRRLLATAATAAALQFTLAAPALAAPPPIEAYGALPALEQVEISPDGQKIAFIATVGGTRALGVRSLAGQDLGGVRLGDQKVRDIRWGDDGHVLITTSMTTNVAFAAGGYYFDKGEHYTAQSYDIAKRSFVTLLDHGASTTSNITRIKGNVTNSNMVLGAPEIRMVDGQPTVLVGGYDKEYNGVWFKIDLKTGQGRLFNENFGVLDEAGQVVAKEEYYEDEGRWRLMAREGTNWKELYVDEDARIDTPSLLGAGRKPGTVLMAVPEKTANVIYEVTLATGARTKLSFGDLGEGVPFHDGRTGRLLGFTFTGETDTEVVFLDDALAKSWASIRAGFKNSRVSIQSWTPDFKKWVIETEGPNDAGSVLLVDLVAGKASKLGGAYPAVPGDAVNEVRLVHYKAADGLDIPAYLTLPRGREAKNLALIVLPHGGPATRDYPGFDWWAQALASRGYAVLQPQYRGSDGFGPEFLAAGYGEYGRKMQTDLSDGVRWLAKDGVIDPKRVCIAGASYGGSAALGGATLDTGVYRCASAVAGVADIDWKMADLKEKEGQGDTQSNRFWTRYMGPRESWASISPIKHVDRVTIPVQLIHGKDDVVVPIQHSYRFRDAMKAAGKTVEFTELGGEDHWLSRGETRVAMLQAQIAFLEKHNPPN
ncbi:S9 family peptidase [Caulobacter sp. 17J80-11]|uniref:alpha/beta hydrolase family protein n=1 Tax=Caulobacter sp. 17J80-11 TaxID=2763502 RepID=UPI001653DE18|nr:S9 family peptidase [Caulobacter sp. 17J80-11]MBC6982930.1 S9 family peptidase [Caulobacter sp. 17J80-11]